MRLVIVLSFILSLNIKLSSSQELVQDISKKEYLFNPELIAKKGIKKVHLTYSYKYDLDIIKPSNEEVYYEFDKDGRILSSLVINPFRKRRDSIQTLYFRNKSGDVATKVKHDPIYTYVDLFEYENEMLVKHENYQMRKNLNWNENIYPDKLMWSDSTSYSGEFIEVYNQFGTKYQKYKVHYDDLGNILEIRLN